MCNSKTDVGLQCVFLVQCLQTADGITLGLLNETLAAALACQTPALDFALLTRYYMTTCHNDPGVLGPFDAAAGARLALIKSCCVTHVMLSAKYEGAIIRI